jgi:succinate dehydrogenase flavin-adding protein (antitoxin of CptAB toxin-antitoxin module)
MGCCCGKDEVEEDPLSQATIEYIRDNLEANLVKQSTLNAELNNCYKQFEGKDNTTPEEVVKAYSDLLIKLTNTTTEKESNDIRELLTNAMKLVNNNYSSFHTIVFEKLQGLKDYTNIKEKIDKDSKLKKAIKDNEELLKAVFQDLKEQGITDISQLTFEKFKETCQKHGVKMTDEELKKYYDLLQMKPKDGIDIAEDIKKKLDSNPDLKKAIEDNRAGFIKLINKINKEGIDITKLSFDEFKKLCKECGIKLTDEQLKEIYDLMQQNFPGFINYINNYGQENKNEDGDLVRKAYKLGILAKIDLQALPVAQKLERNY